MVNSNRLVGEKVSSVASTVVMLGVFGTSDDDTDDQAGIDDDTVDDAVAGDGDGDDDDTADDPTFSETVVATVSGLDNVVVIVGVDVQTP